MNEARDPDGPALTPHIMDFQIDCHADLAREIVRVIRQEIAAAIHMAGSTKTPLADRIHHARAAGFQIVAEVAGPCRAGDREQDQNRGSNPGDSTRQGLCHG